MNHDNEVLLQHTRFLMQNYAFSKRLVYCKKKLTCWFLCFLCIVSCSCFDIIKRTRFIVVVFCSR